MASKLILILLGTTNVFVTTPNDTLVVPERNSSSTSIETHIETEKQRYTPGIGAHKVRSKKTTWVEGMRGCQAEGGHLAFVNSAGEAKVISKIASTQNSGINWIGFHDFFEEGHFVTLNGQSIDDLYTGWYTGEPNNLKPAENCVVIFDTDGTLNDENCQRNYNSICELPYP